MAEDLDFTSKVEESLLINQYNYMDQNLDLGKVLWYRFLRGAIAGGVSSGSTIAFLGDNTLSNLHNFIITLCISLIVGALTGGLMAIDKFMRV